MNQPEMLEPTQPLKRRVHRLSPLLRGWAVMAAIVAAILFNSPQAMGSLYDALANGHLNTRDLAESLGVMIGAVLVVVAGSQLWWSRIWFQVGAEDLELHKGFFSSQVRSARYDKIQAVDVVEPLAARIFGLAAVRTEVAGGANSAIEIAFIPRAEADRLRAELLGRMDYVGTAAADGAGSATDAATEHTATPLVAPIPIQRSIVATLFLMTTMLSLAWATVPLWTGLGAAAVVPVLVGTVPSIWKMIDQSWRFTATLGTLGTTKTQGETGTPGQQVVNVAYGLANRRRQAMPLARIHAASLTQPPLWRLFGWWTVSVTVAGYGSERSKQTGTSKLLPVGTLEQALEVLAGVAPLDAHAVTEMATSPEGYAGALWRAPRAARWVSPIDWRRETVTLTGDVLAVTLGRISRRVRIVLVPHIQELTRSQGIVQRRLHLASLRADLVPGPVRATAKDLSAPEADELMARLRERELPPLQLAYGRADSDSDQYEYRPPAEGPGWGGSPERD